MKTCGSYKKKEIMGRKKSERHRVAPVPPVPPPVARDEEGIVALDVEQGNVPPVVPDVEQVAAPVQGNAIANEGNNITIRKLELAFLQREAAAERVEAEKNRQFQKEMADREAAFQNELAWIKERSHILLSLFLF